MPTLNNRVYEFAKKHRVKKRSVIVASVLSLAVVLTVCVSLIMPAISVTGDSNLFNAEINGANNNEIMPIAGDTFDFSEFLVYDEVENGFYTHIKVEDGQEDNLDSKEVEFYLGFNIDPETARELLENNRSFTMKLPDNVVVPEEGIVGTTTDGELNSGDYTIDKDGNVTFKFKDEYLKQKAEQAQSSGIQGVFSFKSSVQRDKDNAGDVDVQLGSDSSSPKLTVDFAERSASVQKSGVSNGDGTITWTIVISNPDHEDLTKDVLSDDMFQKAMESGAKLTVEPSDVQLNWNGTGYELGGNTNNAEEITVTYTTAIPEEDTYHSGNIVNNAHYQPSDPNAPSSSSKATVPYEAGFSVEKSGVADYLSGQGRDADKKIIWTVTVNNKYGGNLRGFVIQDDAFKGLSRDDLKLPPSVGFDFDSSTGKVTITSDYRESLTFTYETDAAVAKSSDPDNPNKNVVNLYSPKEGEDLINTAENTPDYFPYELDKAHVTINYDERTIEWKINVNFNGNGSQKAKGLTIQDDMLKDLPEGTELKFTYNYYLELPDSSYTFDKDSGTVTFNEEVEGLTHIEITYTTPFDEDSESITNTAIIGKNSEEYTRDTDTVNYSNRHTISKYEVSAAEADGKLDIQWSSTIQNDDSISGKTYSDTLSSNIPGSDEPLHYFTKAQADSIKISKSTGSYTYEEMESGFTVTFYDEAGNKVDFDSDPNARAVKFEIKFDESDDNSAIKNFKVEYSSTADVDSMPAGNWDLINGAEFNECDPVEAKHQHRVYDTENIPYNKYDADEATANQGFESQADGKTSSLLLDMDKDSAGNYIFSWIIALNENGELNGVNSGLLQLSDTLPKGFTFIDDVRQIKLTWDKKIPWDDLNNTNNYTIIKNNTDAESKNGWEDYFEFETTAEGNQKIKFHFNDQATFGTDPYYIWYKAKIPAETLDQMIKDAGGTLSIKNSVVGTVDGVQYDPVVQQHDVSKGLISKKDKLAAPNYLNYSVEINPDSKRLSKDGKEIKLEDIFRFAGADQKIAEVQLSAFEVSVLDDEGNVVRKLSPGEFSYIIDTQPEEIEVKCTLEECSTDNLYVEKAWKITNYGSEIKMVIKGEPNSYFNGTFISEVSGTLNWSTENFLFDETGIKELTYTIPTNCTNVYFGCYDHGGLVIQNTEQLSASSMAAEYAAKLEMTVPDYTHLRIDYTYFATPKEGVLKGENAEQKLEAMNSINVTTNGKLATSTNNATLTLTNSTSGQTTTKNYVTVRKVDVTDNTVCLNAKFYISRYNKDNDVWEYATKITKAESGTYITDEVYKIEEWSSTAAAADRAVIETSADVNSQYCFDVDSFAEGTIYRMEEIEAPDGYVQPGSGTAWYFSYRGRPAELPDGVNSVDVAIVINGSNFDIKNYRPIEITVDKTWTDGKAAHSADSVTVKLYRSFVYTSEGLPDKDKLEAVMIDGKEASAELNEANDWSYTWTGLPSGTLTRPYYYYAVEEETNTSDGKTYTAVYTGNGINEDGTISIMNTTGLVVQKVWSDVNGKPIDPPADIPSIKFNLYKSKISPEEVSGDLPDPSEMEICEANVELNADNEWQYKFEELEKADSDGKQWYYYVEEIDVPEGYTANYVYNNDGNVGVIIIANVYESTVSETVVMPETGGTGHTANFVAGALTFAVLVFTLTKKKLDSLK